MTAPIAAPTPGAPLTPGAPAAPAQGVNLRMLLEEMIERNASDLHITAGERAKLRIDGDIGNSNNEYVMGPTGSGKYTTLAAMIDKINRERKGQIITVGDPIEFIHRHQCCIVNQREVGTDTNSFQSALKYALREDPDVILVGELRDLDTIQAALTIAEPGHLAFATLHTNSAAEAINRSIDVFPSHQQPEVRAQRA